MDGSPAIFLLVAGHRVRGVTFQRGCVGKRVHLGSRTSVSHQRGAACHRPLDVRLSGARFHPDGTRSMRQPAGSAVRAVLVNPVGPRYDRAGPKSGRLVERRHSARGDRQPAAGVVPPARGHAATSSHLLSSLVVVCPGPIGAQLRGLRAVGLEDQGLQRLSVHCRVPANGL